MYKNCRTRARTLGIPFEIKREDIVIPETCPILGMRIIPGYETSRDCSPSVDRIEPNKGYTKDNIQVISYLANRMKNNGTLEQLVMLGEWAKSVLSKIR